MPAVRGVDSPHIPVIDPAAALDIPLYATQSLIIRSLELKVAPAYRLHSRLLHVIGRV
jgi:hypothetical protein